MGKEEKKNCVSHGQRTITFYTVVEMTVERAAHVSNSRISVLSTEKIVEELPYHKKHFWTHLQCLRIVQGGIFIKGIGPYYDKMIQGDAFIQGTEF